METADPTKMTVGTLKKELESRGVEFTKDYVRKDVLVNLYRQHVLGLAVSPGRLQASEFSSDEEDSFARNRKVILIFHQSFKIYFRISVVQLHFEFRLFGLSFHRFVLSVRIGKPDSCFLN